MAIETIGVDADDVIAAHAAAFAHFSNTNYGTSITAEDYDEDWDRLWGGGMSWEEIELRAAEFHTPEVTMDYAKIEEAVPVLEELHNDYQLAIITARPKQIVPATYDWLNLHYSGLFDQVHFVPIWEPTNTVTKADICKEIGADYLVDDVVKHCNIASKVGITALLFGNYGWNQVGVESGVIRVESWQAVREFFNERRRS